jgi:hypothetical protein
MEENPYESPSPEPAKPGPRYAGLTRRDIFAVAAIGIWITAMLFWTFVLGRNPSDDLIRLLETRHRRTSAPDNPLQK